MAENPDPEPVLTGKNISFLELTSERATEIQRLTDAIGKVLTCKPLNA